ncbi:hypothetical protein AAC387_Pa02g2611 [Persea americana]
MPLSAKGTGVPLRPSSPIDCIGSPSTPTCIEFSDDMQRRRQPILGLDKVWIFFVYGLMFFLWIFVVFLEFGVAARQHCCLRWQGL